MTWAIAPDQVAAVLRFVAEELVPQVRDQPGFQGSLTLQDTPQDKVLVLTLWASAADLAATERSGGYQATLSKVAPFLTAPPTREAYTVVSAQQAA